MNNKKWQSLFLAALTLFMSFALNPRTILVTLFTSQLILVKSALASYATVGGSDIPPTKEQQINNATQPANNPAITSGSAVVGGVINSITSQNRNKGLQFKDPMVSVGTTYRSVDDTSSGGFDGNEMGGDVSFDFDIIDGYIVGGLYSYLYRGATNVTGTSEHLESNGVSLYMAKRWMDLFNSGASYSFSVSDHRLTRAANINLDRDSHGLTLFTGLSKKMDTWGWATTPSVTFVHDIYDQQKDLDTIIFTINNGMSYDLSKEFTLGVTGGYNHLILADRFADSDERDDDFWTIGPRLQYYPTDKLTFSLEYNAQQGFRQLTAHTIRLAASYAF